MGVPERWTLQGSGVFGLEGTVTGIGRTHVDGGRRLRPDERFEVVPASQLWGAVAALRDVYSLLEGFRCLNVLDAPVADLDGARERVRAALEEVETA